MWPFAPSYKVSSIPLPKGDQNIDSNSPSGSNFEPILPYEKQGASQGLNCSLTSLIFGAIPSVRQRRSPFQFSKAKRMVYRIFLETNIRVARWRNINTYLFSFHDAIQ